MKTNIQIMKKNRIDDKHTIRTANGQIVDLNQNWENKIRKHRYTEDILEQIIDYVDIKTLVKTQKLSLPFIQKHIIGNKSHVMKSRDLTIESHKTHDNDITINDVAYFQNYPIDMIHDDEQSNDQPDDRSDRSD
jgi:hypothetical protein